MDTINPNLPGCTPPTVDISYPLCTSCRSKFNHLSNPPVPEFSHSVFSYIRSGFNLPFYSGEVARMKNFIAGTSESITEYDKAIAEMEGLLIGLKNARDDLQRHSDGAQYLISAPIRKLPLDVLNEIFTFYCDMGAPVEARYSRDKYGRVMVKDVYSFSMSSEIFCPTLKLSWVCSFWRTFVQSCPNLWSSLKVSASVFQSKPGAFPLLLKYLSHSANNFLDFSFNVKEESLWSNPKVQQTTDLLLECPMRWRHAALTFANGSGSMDWFLWAAASLSTKSLKGNGVQSGSFPALEYLDISAQWSNEVSVFLQSFSSCPRLRVVCFSAFSWSGHNADFSCVTRLILIRFIGKSFGHLLRRLPLLETLSVDAFELSEDSVDNTWPRPGEHYSSSLSRLCVGSSVLQPVAWRFIRLPRLTDMTLFVTDSFAAQNMQSFSSMLRDSRCRLKSLRMLVPYNGVQQTMLDFIALQLSLVHLTVHTHTLDPFVRLLQSGESGASVVRNLRSLTFINTTTVWYGLQTLGPSICDIVESRCTVIQSPEGHPQISGLQALTLDLGHNDRVTTFSRFVHNRLSPLKDAGFKLSGRYLDL